MDRPRSREKNVTGPAKTVNKRGEGLGTGPVGAPRKQSGGESAGTRSSGTRSAGGFKMIILLAILFLGGGSGGLMAMLGGQTGQSQSGTGGLNVSSLISSLGGGSVSSGWQGEANTGKLDATVDPAARSKRVTLLGDGKDTATIMVYMCGTDLESRAGMGTSDLQEMLAAEFDSSVNLLVYTGGCKGWKNNQVSSTTNQIWQIKNGGLLCLEKDLGAVPMTDPEVLTGFIQYCAKNYPASRYELILWDHGGGSISGYGYDEKFAQSGSMGLAAIDQALTRAGVTFDFIGFDACLMATAENALMLARHADYLIASEETEPGVGWYYTNWLTEFGKNPSMPTIEVGNKIADDFVDVCAQKCPGQLTTLSVIDLAELEATLPDKLNDFSKAASKLIVNKEYQTVSNARSSTREFAQSSKIDHVDLVHLAKNLGSQEANALADTLLGAVKYNRTSSNMTNAYGVSIYFPYRNNSSAVNNAVKSYQAVGMDSDYIRCIQQFSDMKTAGQHSSGGSNSMSALEGMLGSNVSLEDIAGFLQMAMRDGLFSDRSLDLEQTAQYISDHHLIGEDLRWSEYQEDGTPVLRLSEEQWSLVQDLDLNVFVDDGGGYIDLGLDNVFDFNDNGDLLGAYDNTWLAINGQPVAYYHTGTVDDGEHYTITGYVPVLHNGQRSELLLTFDNDQPYGYVAGVRAVYPDGETETVAKSDIALQEGDVLEFVCDYYGYGENAGPPEDFHYLDSYLLGEPVTVDGEGLTISNVPLEGKVRASYRFTDLYNNQFWTAAIS
ncbi:clostripain-related cysteine peptidase [Flintibacter muris]|uniref:clostripain-related cysteine peptidase n=1 Tax=Flintibacter muris TaxID=2941327 RepID=UPI002040634D|nr:clostripain-related cysteine peptidase [Flintibacter muris]